MSKEMPRGADLGQRISGLRKERQLGRSQFARQIGIEYQSLANIENGHRQPSLALLITIADELGMTLDSLIWGEKAAA